MSFESIEENGEVTITVIPDDEFSYYEVQDPVVGLFFIRCNNFTGDSFVWVPHKWTFVGKKEELRPKHPEYVRPIWEEYSITLPTKEKFRNILESN